MSQEDRKRKQHKGENIHKAVEDFELGVNIIVAKTMNKPGLTTDQPISMTVGDFLGMKSMIVGIIKEAYRSGYEDGKSGRGMQYGQK